MALEVGRLFYVEKEIMAYDRLGIGKTYLSASNESV